MFVRVTGASAEVGALGGDMARKINDAGLNLIKQHEGCCLAAYSDVAGIWTIGYGHIKGVHHHYVRVFGRHRSASC